MKEIILSKNNGVAIIDDCDYEFINSFKWRLSTRGYAITNSKRIGRQNQKSIFMHKLILGISGTLLQGDHINHIQLDNRRINLRVCDKFGNNRNKLPSGKYKYLGVHQANIKRKSGKIDSYIRSTITYNGKTYYLGHFKDEISAAKAYDLKAKEFFGEFANLNFK